MWAKATLDLCRLCAHRLLAEGWSSRPAIDLSSILAGPVHQGTGGSSSTGGPPVMPLAAGLGRPGVECVVEDQALSEQCLVIVVEGGQAEREGMQAGGLGGEVVPPRARWAPTPRGLDHRARTA